MGGYNRTLVQTNEGDRRVARPGDGMLQYSKVAPLTNDANNVLTPAQILGGLITSNNKTANRNLQLPLASDFAAAVPNMDVGDTLMVQVASLDGFTAVITTNTGWTLTGNVNVVLNSAKEIYIERTGAATFNAIVL